MLCMSIHGVCMFTEPIFYRGRHGQESEEGKEDRESSHQEGGKEDFKEKEVVASAMRRHHQPPIGSVHRRPDGAYGLCEEYRRSHQAPCNPPWLGWRHNEIVDPDRKPSQANARRVPDCTRDRAGRARDADFADALDAKCVHVRIVFLDHERFQAWYVGVHRDVVFGEVRTSRDEDREAIVSCVRILEKRSLEQFQLAAAPRP